MTLQELLELAHLGAQGHLDEREQAAFDAAFDMAPPQVRAQIRSEQARWASMDHLLPEVSPSPELRERVLNAVTAAMVNQGAGELSLRQGRRVSSAWRTASMGLITAVIVLGTAFVYVYDTSRDSDVTAQIGLTTEGMLNGFKGDFLKAAVDPLTERRFFELASTASSEKNDAGAVWTNPAWTKARVFLVLPKNTAGKEYRLVVIGSGNKIGQELDKFDSNGVMLTREINASQLPAKTRVAGRQRDARQPGVDYGRPDDRDALRTQCTKENRATWPGFFMLGWRIVQPSTSTWPDVSTPVSVFWALVRGLVAPLVFAAGTPEPVAAGLVWWPWWPLPFLGLALAWSLVGSIPLFWRTLSTAVFTAARGSLVALWRAVAAASWICFSRAGSLVGSTPAPLSMSSSLAFQPCCC